MAQATSTDPVEVLVAALRANGGRMTAGRRAIAEVLVATHGHLTAEELLAAVADRHPDLHLSTVYRTLETLEEVGLVCHVHFGHGAAQWHLTSDDRHHLVCESCGAVTHVPASLLEPVRDELRRTYGFEASLRHFATPGRCPVCAGATD
jgi:Fur family transcriptional regulator, ferric uptake regulator